MAFVNTVDKYGDSMAVGMFIDGSIPEYCDSDVKTISGYAFATCESLAFVDIPNVARICNRAFQGTAALKTLVLRSYAGLVTLENTDAFTGWNTAIKNGEGYIYVPSALLAEYQAATNWSTYANQFRALEDYTVDGTVSGDLDETKI